MLPLTEVDVEAMAAAAKIAIDRVLYSPGRKAHLCFFKKDGSVRDMIIIRPSDIPVIPGPDLTAEERAKLPATASPTPRNLSDKVIRVYEDNVGWRSFCAENFISVEPYTELNLES